ncbi:MAG: hypothetical protein PHN49_04305 [Candidatus Omnitrophica bacterium]|nr:hypothetical protein [Candidatus Omnitrophota bacterium]MDD5670844.1 hypothetical protein [Candidatus Omnitrophota bacterium]
MTSRVIFVLVSHMALAMRIVQVVKEHHLNVRNFDKADRMVESARLERPAFAILDYDDCEAEAFKVLKAFASDAVLKTIPVVGFVSQSKVMVKTEAERAGCLRVYLKTDFMRSFDDLILRYVQ